MTAEVLGVQPQPAKPARPWIPDDTRFGARLALIRQRMEWGNVKEAALACGVPVQSWRTWERDNVQPRGYEEICRRIARHVGCDLDWLMRGSRRSDSPTDGNERFDRTAGRSAPRPVDNRPSGKPGSRDTPGVRRTSPVQRPPTRKRA